MDTVELLNQLSEYQSQLDLLVLKKQELIDGILTPEIRAKIADIDGEFVEQSAPAMDKIADLTNQVKSLVVSEGATVKGDNLMAVYTKGRTSWDGKMLDGMSKLIPQLEQARTVGAPSVSIHKI
jgi:hypothetical protein